MARRKINRNKLIKTYPPNRRTPVTKNFQSSEPIYGTISAEITGGSANFGTQDTAWPNGPGTYYPDMTVTVSQEGGTVGAAFIEATGTNPGSFQIVELNGLAVGPFDLNDPGISDLLSIGFEGSSTTFKINVKSPLIYGAHSANLIIKDDTGNSVKSFSMSATAVDEFRTAAGNLSGNVRIYSAAYASTTPAIVDEGDETMATIDGSRQAEYGNPDGSATVQLVSTVSGSVPTVLSDVSRPFTSFSLSMGIQGDAFAGIRPAQPIYEPTSGLEGCFALVMQGSLIENDEHNGQGIIFNFTSNTTGAFGDSSLRLQYNGVQTNQIKVRLIGTTSSAEFILDPVRTMLVIFNRDSTGDISLYIQEAGNELVALERDSQATRAFSNLSEFVFYPTSSNLNGSVIRLLAAVVSDEHQSEAALEALALAIR